MQIKMPATFITGISVVFFRVGRRSRQLAAKQRSSSQAKRKQRNGGGGIRHRMGHGIAGIIRRAVTDVPTAGTRNAKVAFVAAADAVVQRVQAIVVQRTNPAAGCVRQRANVDATDVAIKQATAPRSSRAIIEIERATSHLLATADAERGSQVAGVAVIVTAH